MKRKGKKSFESSLKRLEEIVRQMEEGNVPLEETLKLFEEGITLSRSLREQLDSAEQRITILLKQHGEELPVEKSFDSGDES